ncbi:O-antigen ligase family protein [Microbacterium enclense]|uniref:O-antigen ligase family protein n=1 Tax=Microbacterium enclense TaxID=993073 RepID=UPI0036DF64AB
MSRSSYLVARPPARVAGRTWALLAGAAVVVIGATGAAIRALDQPGPEIVVLIPALAVVAVAVFLVPVHWLPSVVVAVLALFPTRFIPSDGPFNALPPLAILLGVWVVRRLLWPQDRGRLPQERSAALVARYAVYATAIALTAWLLLSVALTGVQESSLGWTVSFVASVFVPLLVLDARREVALLRKTLLVVGALAGAYVVGEMVLGFSPLYGTASGDLLFSVYRARGAFSHPLFAAAFLTIPAALGLGTWLTEGRRWPLVAAAISAAGVMATVSRGPLAALGIAVAFAVLLSPLFIGWAHLRRWVQLLAVAAIGAVAVLNFGPLAERADSIESRISAEVRDRAVDVSIRAADFSGWIGTGPGTSGQTSRLFDTIIIENSLLQLLISIGIPGLLLFVLFVAALALRTTLTGALGPLLALIAYVVAIAGFNTLDAVRSMHVVVGVLALLCVHGGTRTRDPLSPAAVARPATGTAPRATLRNAGAR